MDADGNYFLSQSQVAEAVNKDESSTRRFLRSKELQAILGKASAFGIITLTVSHEAYQGSTQVKVLPIEVVTAYWASQAYKGNVKAQMLNYACLTEALERRCDKAFGEEKSEDKRNLLLAERATWGDARGYCSSEVKRNLSECCI